MVHIHGLPVRVVRVACPVTQLEVYNRICAALQDGSYRPHAPWEDLLPTKGVPLEQTESKPTGDT